jgi:hypothetical protein
MAFIFPTRSTTRQAPLGNMSQSRSSTPSSLPVISEDGAPFLGTRTPPIPPRSSSRPLPRTQLFGQPPRHNYDLSPPPYSGFDPDGVTGPKGEKLSTLRKEIARDIRNNKFFAERGGWWRVVIFTVILICIIVGLAIGLIFGLESRNNESSRYGITLPLIARS